MVWGVYMGLERRLQEHLEDQQHGGLLQQILEWQSNGGAEEVERRLLEMVEELKFPRDDDA